MVLLLGGTGAIGTNLVDILEKKGIETIVTSRSQHEDHHTIKYVYGNAKDIDFLANLCKNKWDAIVDFMSYKTEEFSERVELLLKCTKQYVFISSSRVYADQEHPIKESSPRLLDVSTDKEYLATDEYALTKARQEDILLNSSHRNFTIVRPYITFDTNRLQLGVMEKEEWLYRALQGHTIVFPKDMLNKLTTMTHGSDVAKGIFGLLGKVEAIGEVFHITTKHSYTWAEIIQIYSNGLKKATGNKLQIKLVSTDDFLSCREEQLKWQYKYDRLFDREFDITREQSFVNEGDFKIVEDSLIECLVQFIDRGAHFKPVNYKYEAIKDKLTDERLKIIAPPSFKQKVKYLLYRYIL